MAKSTFNPDSFLGATYTEATSDKSVPVPEGEYQAQIVKLTPRFEQGKEKDRTILDITWEILDDTVRAEAGVDKLFCRQSLFLDTMPSGGIDMGKGKNVSLGKVRSAVGQNADGKPWSMTMLNGQLAIIKVKQRDNPDDPENPFSDVKGVAPLS